jgi:hypothetical protein
MTFFNKLMGVPEGYRPPLPAVPHADDMPLIVGVLIIAGCLLLICAAWTTLASDAGVAVGLSWSGAAVLLFAVASAIRKLYQIEFHLRARA